MKHAQMLKIFVGGLLVAVCMLSACKREPEAAKAEAEPSVAVPQAEVQNDAVLVTVGDEVLTQGEADRRVRMLAMRQGVPQNSLDQALEMFGDQLQKQVIEQFIDTSLLLQEAQRREIAVSEEVVDGVLSNMLARLPAGLSLEQVLESQGVTIDAVRSDISKSEQLKKLYELETADVAPVDEEAIAAFYKENPDKFQVEEEVTASHILVKSSPTASEEEKAKAKGKAESLRKLLVEGGDFAELAKAESDCPSRSRGGDLGPFGRGRMDPAFEEAAFSQKVGEVGPVVESQFGYHIIKVADRQDSHMLTLDEARERISSYLNGEKKGKAFAELVAKLRENGAVQRNGGEESDATPESE